MAAYAAPIKRLCAVYTSGGDRDDLFQEIFLAIWRSLPGFRGDASLRTWVYRVAHNVALTRQARDRRRRSRESALDDTVQPTQAADLRQLALREALERMSPADRSLTLLWLEGLSASEIEDVTGIKAATVAVRLSRIRRQLLPPEASHG